MKRLMFWTGLLVSFVAVLPVPAGSNMASLPPKNGEAAVRAAVLPFLETLRTGNPDFLAQAAGKSMIALKNELSADPQYARMIRSRYENAVLTIREVAFQSERDAVVDISVEYPDGTREDIAYSVVRNAAGAWALDSEIRKP